MNDEKSAEELAKIAEKRKESGKRLQEMQQKARLEKVRPPATSLSPRKPLESCTRAVFNTDHCCASALFFL